MATEVTQIAKLSGGTAGTVEFAAALQSSWEEVLADSERSHAAAAILGIPVTELKQIRQPPFEVESDSCGMLGADLLIIAGTWVATEILVGAIKNIAQEEVERLLRRLWREVLAPATQRLLGAEKFGSEADSDDNG
jgi:hypothetical protein